MGKKYWVGGKTGAPSGDMLVLNRGVLAIRSILMIGLSDLMVFM